MASTILPPPSSIGVDMYRAQLHEAVDAAFDAGIGRLSPNEARAIGSAMATICTLATLIANRDTEPCPPPEMAVVR